MLTAIRATVAMLVRGEAGIAEMTPHLVDLRLASRGQASDRALAQFGGRIEITGQVVHDARELVTTQE